jgi:hypothetical protein
MRTFGLFMFLFLAITILLSLMLKDWTSQEIVTQSTIFAYIMQQYLVKQFKQHKNKIKL